MSNQAQNYPGHVPVLIVGAGAAGLSMSLFLLQQGIPFLLIERRSEVSWVPRARNLNFRTLEALRSLRLGEQVRTVGNRVSRVFSKTNLVSGEEKELLDPMTLVQNIGEYTPEPLIWYCPQSRLEPLMLMEAKRRGGDVRYNTELVSFSQGPSGLQATIRPRDSDQTFDLQADYLIAADGAHSKIRDAADIPTSGYGELPEQNIFVYFYADWGQLIKGYEADGIIVGGNAFKGMFISPERDRGMFMIFAPPSASPADYTRERCKEMILAGIGVPSVKIEISDVVPWRPIQRVAERFQKGRVFLVGDAAHTMPPKLGLGANTAIQSAQNLAWKLASVIKGKADPRLLGTYDEERHPVGTLAAEQSLTGPASDLFRGQPDYRPGKQLPLLRILLGYPYRSYAIVEDYPDTSQPEDAGLDDHPRLDGMPGTRIPHMWLIRKGQRISTLDLIDGGFILFTGRDGAAWIEAANHIATGMGIGLSAYRIGGDDDLSGPGNADLSDPDNQWQKKTGLMPEGMILVRPDAYVAWRSKTMPVDLEGQLERAFSQILAYTPMIIR
jgi:putative polyketide hydroxylase